MTPEGVQLTPKGVREAPSTVRLAPKRVRLAPKGVQLAPRGVQLAPKGVRLAPKGVHAMDGGCTVLGAMCTVLRATCTVPGATCTLLGATRTVLGATCTLLGASCTVLGASCTVLGAHRGWEIGVTGWGWRRPMAPSAGPTAVDASAPAGGCAALQRYPRDLSRFSLHCGRTPSQAYLLPQVSRRLVYGLVTRPRRDGRPYGLGLTLRLCSGRPRSGGSQPGPPRACVTTTT